MMRIDRRAQLGLATGLAALALYATLGGLLLAGAIPLAVAATALIVVQAGRGALNTAIFATNQHHEDGLYYPDLRAFLARAARYRPRAGGRRSPASTRSGWTGWD